MNIRKNTFYFQWEKILILIIIIIIHIINIIIIYPDCKIFSNPTIVWLTSFFGPIFIPFFLAFPVVIFQQKKNRNRNANRTIPETKPSVISPQWELNVQCSCLAHWNIQLLVKFGCCRRLFVAAWFPIDMTGQLLFALCLVSFFLSLFQVDKMCRAYKQRKKYVYFHLPMNCIIKDIGTYIHTHTHNKPAFFNASFLLQSTIIMTQHDTWHRQMTIPKWNRYLIIFRIINSNNNLL